MSGAVSSRRTARQRGFALLLIFAMAGAVAILLYLELPRAVFESARAKEELLVERGEQYKLAIRRYYAKTKQLPTTIEQLENTNGVRFLRRRYKDPMTGEEEWRLVHWGPGGYTDSKVFKPVAEAKSDSRPGSIWQGYQVGGAGEGPAEDVQKGQQDVAFRQRPTDRLPEPSQPGSPGADPASEPGAGNTGLAGDPPPPGTPLDPATGLPLAPPNPSPGPGVTPTPAANPFYPGQQFVPGQAAIPPPGAPGNVDSGAPFPGVTVNPINSQTGGQATIVTAGSIGTGSMFGNLGGNSAQPNPPAAGIFPGQPGYPTPQQQQAQQSAQGRPIPGTPAGNPAVEMIRNLLTQPRPAPAGLTGAAPATPLAAGIAGVASKGKGIGIKRIHDREKIEEWEFLFDPTKAVGGALAANPGVPGPVGPAGRNPGHAGAAPGASPADRRGTAPSGFGSPGFSAPGLPPPGFPPVGLAPPGGTGPAGAGAPGSVNPPSLPGRRP